MFTSRDLVMFVAGAFCLHTVSHILFPYVLHLPADFNLSLFTPAISILWTPTLNWIVVAVSAVITTGLLWWATTLKK